jgi:hypothetical protein
MLLESKRAKTVCTKTLHAVDMRGRLALVRGEVELGCLGRITLTAVFGIRGCVLVLATPAPRVTHVGNYARKSVGMKDW